MIQPIERKFPFRINSIGVNPSQVPTILELLGDYYNRINEVINLCNDNEKVVTELNSTTKDFMDYIYHTGLPQEVKVEFAKLLNTDYFHNLINEQLFGELDSRITIDLQKILPDIIESNKMYLIGDSDSVTFNYNKKEYFPKTKTENVLDSEGNSQENINQNILTDIANISDNKKIKIVSGVIRNVGNGWEFIIDGTHDKINLSNVSVNGNNIVLDYGFNASKILSLTATLDETLTKQGYSLGASVGTSLSNIQLFKESENVFASITKEDDVFVISEHGKNGIKSMELNPTNNRLTIYHDDIGSFNQIIQNRNLMYTPIIKTANNEMVVISFGSNRISTELSYNGTNWIPTSQHGIESISWNATHGRLEIIHKECKIYDASVNSRTHYTVGITSIAPTQTWVTFYNNGVKVTTPDTNCKIVFARNGFYDDILPENGNVRFNLLGITNKKEIVNPNDVIEPLGNIWINGVFEI